MRKLLLPVLAALVAATVAALAANTVFFTSIGDQTFPFTSLKCLATGATPQTCNGGFGSVTSGTLTTAAATTATFVINNSSVVAGQAIMCSMGYSGTGDPVIESCTATAGVITVTFRNVNTTTALNAAIQFNFQTN